MRKKIVGILIMTLLIVSAFPAVTSMNDIDSNTTFSNIIQTGSLDTWSEIQKFTASDGIVDGRFGHSVSISGNTALIGAVGDDENGAYSGSAYIFTYNGNTWTQQAKLIPSDGAADDWFGYSIFLNGDTAIIGADRDDDKGTDSGSAYVFIRSGNTWTQQAKLTASDGVKDATFGYDVFLNGDTALIGAANDDEYKGSTYVFTRTDTTWTQQQKLTASDGRGGDWFGSSVSLNDDTVFIGAPGSDEKGVNSGSVYVFTYTNTIWIQQQKMFASDAVGDANFGVDIDYNGDTALIGAYNDRNNQVKSGSAYVFIRSGSTWIEQANLNASDGAAGDWFGRSVSLSEDTALIGAYNDDNETGSAYIFTRTGSTWTQQQKLTASDGAAGNWFGKSVFLIGNTAFIGASHDDDKGAYSGSMYIFAKENHPPNKPTITGETNGKINDEYTYIISTTDSDNHQVAYYVDWGDETNSGWTEFYNSGEEASLKHTWTVKDTYLVKVKAKDIYGAESDWTTLEVIMPKSKAINSPLFLQKLFQCFPIFEKILK